MGSESRTTREALAALMLEEIDTLLARIETLPATITNAEERLAATVAALDTAGNKYRVVITAFTEEAKTETVTYLERKTSQITSRTMEEQRSAMQAAARIVLEEEITGIAARLNVALAQAAKEFRRSTWMRPMEHAITALIASSCTAGLVYWIVR
jgi:hypothetical protein